MTSLRDLFLLNWRQKLLSLLLAIIVWGAVKEDVEPGSLDQIWHGTALQGK